MRIILLSAFLLAASASAEQLTVTPHWINSGLNNRDLTISPDGKTLLSTTMSPASQFAAIVVSKKTWRGWSRPVIASFSGTWSDIEPMFSPDGQRLWFASKRPKPDREGEDWDLWYVTLDGDTWSEPVNPGAPINSPANEFYPSIAANGNVYFTAERDFGEGSEDILRAIAEGDRYVRVESVGTGVNSPGFEFNAFVAADESFLVFSAQGGRDDAIGGGDLYISRRDDNRGFGKAQILPEPVNSTLLDYCPFVFDGLLYFSSRRFVDRSPFASVSELNRALSEQGNGLGDIYSVPLGSLLN